MAKDTGSRRGPQAFHSHYLALFPDRWENLAYSLSGENIYRTLQPEPSCEPYHLDEASVVAAEALEVRPGMRVLDLCAAPGGKSLILASALQGQGELTCNELSPDRRGRLARNLQASLPADWRSIIKVTGYDGTTWGIRNQGGYDRILVDAPCSSERHVLASPPHLAEWSPARSKNLSHRQLALACAAFDSLAPGGSMVYGTCALDPRENTGVMEMLAKKRKEAVSFDTPSQTIGEADGPGWRIWPDQCHGRGPIWFCRVVKARSSTSYPT